MILIISFIIGFILSQFLYPASDKHEWKWFLLISTLFTPVSGLIYWWMRRPQPIFSLEISDYHIAFWKIPLHYSKQMFIFAAE